MPPAAQRSEMWDPTRWSRVRAAVDDDPARRDEAWRYLIERYRSPIAACLKAQLGWSRMTDEIVDDFFGTLVVSKALVKADPGKGRFRAYIQGIIRNFVRHLRRGDLTERKHFLELEGGLPEPEAGLRAPDPSAKLDEIWARSLLEDVVRHQLAEPGRRRNLELLLARYGALGRERCSTAELGARYGMTPTAIDVAVHRARESLRSALEDAVRDTVSSPLELASEVHVLCSLIGRTNPELV